MNFASGPRRKMCAMCGDWIDVMEDKSECERFVMHKRCFKCAICDVQLAQGNCSRDDGLGNMQFMTNHHQGAPIWFCRTHMMLGSGEKYELLRKKYGGGR